MSYTISFYNGRIQAEVMGLPRTLSARFLALADRMEIVGPNLGEPHTEVFGGGRGRPGLLLHLGRSPIVMLHNFIKKAHKTPPAGNQNEGG